MVSRHEHIELLACASKDGNMSEFPVTQGHLIHPSAAPGFAAAMGNSDHEGLPKQQNDTRTLVDKPLRSNQRWEDGIRGYDVNIHEIQ